MGADLRLTVLEDVLQVTRPYLATLGFRTNAVSRVVRSWKNGLNPAKPGATGSTPTDSTPLVLFPVPRVRAMSEEDAASSAGKYQSGDLRVDRLSSKHATGGYDPEDLRPVVGQYEEVVYLVTGPNAGEFELVDLETTHNFEYVLTLRRRRTTPFKGSGG